ncbi:unnamed protein product [Haemonchus placei]|uniref:Uncharacterized protein n=1 Tax=Haemonchus placei TaxID=6290 RepID=A0A0N4WZ16_HAEPC|nr:unnamed protein product [Haemonchus placei]
MGVYLLNTATMMPATSIIDSRVIIIIEMYMIEWSST